MKDQIVRLTDKPWKTIGFNDSLVIVSNKRHKSFETLLANKGGIGEEFETIPLRCLRRIRYNESENAISLHHDNRGKQETLTVQPANRESRNAFATALAESHQMDRSAVEESKVTPLLGHILGSVLISGITWWGITEAMAEESSYHTTSGRKKAIGLLLISAFRALGPIPVGIIGAIGVGLVAFRGWKRFQNPGKVISFDKKVTPASAPPVVRIGKS